MTTLIVPALEEEPWPTLGPQVCQFIESYLVFGPGDLRGLPAKIDSEKRALIYRAYEIFPQGHPNAGRRRFRRVCFSLRKGTAKTEMSAWIAACELHPEGPVRCDGFRDGQPIARGVVDPYIPLVAYTEEQTEDLAYHALHTILSEGPLVNDFDIGLERIMRKKGDGKATALSAAPDARDGARTTFEAFDETHRFTLPRLKRAHRTMLANLPKRRASDAWALETTTAFAVGEGSVAEDTMEYARAIAAGDAENPQLFYFHRQASDDLDISTPEGLRSAILEASGDTAGWSDLKGIEAQFEDPTADRALLERLWLNRPVAGGGRAFPAEKWADLAKDFTPPEGSLITLGFDGSRFRDATAIIATHVETGYQWAVGVWEAPPLKATGDTWEVDKQAVDSAMSDAFMRWQVWRAYCDPPLWGSEIAAWAGRWGDKVVVEWWTNQYRKMAYALQDYRTAMINAVVSHDGSAAFARHIANACKQETNVRNEDSGDFMWIIRKDRKDSPFKIDAAVAGCLSWQAREDAIASGALELQEVGVMFV
ncbi:MAG TPA: terminase [Dehalococcoidia bacterium]|nr:terminase [Dehalococcoidia bacterium]